MWIHRAMGTDESLELTGDYYRIDEGLTTLRDSALGMIGANPWAHAITASGVVITTSLVDYSSPSIPGRISGESI